MYRHQDAVDDMLHVFCMHAGSHAIVLIRALPRKWRLIKLDCSQPLAIAKACSAARGFLVVSLPQTTLCPACFILIDTQCNAYC